MFDLLSDRQFELFVEIGKLLSQFILLGLIVSLVANRLQSRAWKHQKKVDLAENRIQRAHQAFSEASRLIDKRIFATNGLIHSKMSGDLDRIKYFNDIYDEVQLEWNGCINHVLAQIEIYIGPDMRKKVDDVLGNELVQIGRISRTSELKDTERLVNADKRITDIRSQVYQVNVEIIRALEDRERAQSSLLSK